MPFYLPLPIADLKCFNSQNVGKFSTISWQTVDDDDGNNFIAIFIPIEILSE